MHQLAARRVGGDGGVQAVLLLTLDFAAQVDAVGRALCQLRRGEGDVHVIVGEIVGEDGLTRLVGDDQQVIGGLGKLQHHEQLGGVCLNGIVHVACADDHAAVDGGAHIGVDAAVLAGGVGQVDGRAAVEDDPAVGVDAVALAARRCTHGGIHIAVVHGQHAHAILGDVEGIIAGGNVEHAAVDRHVAVLDLHALVVRLNGQAARALKAQGHQGADRTVQLGIGFLDTHSVTAGDEVLAALRQLDGHAVFTRRAGITSAVHRNGRGGAAGDLHAVQDQADVVRFTRTHGDLHIRRRAAQAVYAARRNGHHAVGKARQLRRHVAVGFHHMGQVYRRGRVLRNGLAIHGDRLAQDDQRLLRLLCRREGQQQAEGQQRCKQFLHTRFILSG